MDVAGLLLTGGASRRMGRDKADLPWAGTTLARYLGAILSEVARGPVLEVGPGRTSLAAVADGHPGEGPLVAIASGAAALGARGWHGPALVVATDLPRCDAALLAFLADAPGTAPAVPVDHGGHRQVLCARYSPEALSLAVQAAAAGCREVRAALEGLAVLELGPDQWAPVSGPGALTDVDSPEDLAALTHAGSPGGLAADPPIATDRETRS